MFVLLCHSHSHAILFGKMVPLAAFFPQLEAGQRVPGGVSQPKQVLYAIPSGLQGTTIILTVVTWGR